MAGGRAGRRQDTHHRHHRRRRWGRERSRPTGGCLRGVQWSSQEQRAAGRHSQDRTEEQRLRMAEIRRGGRQTERKMEGPGSSEARAGEAGRNGAAGWSEGLGWAGEGRKGKTRGWMSRGEEGECRSPCCFEEDHPTESQQKKGSHLVHHTVDM